MKSTESKATGGSVTEAGLSLVECLIAMLIIMIALLGVVHAFTYAINYNAGNSSRAQALAVMQEKVELLRSAKFTSGYTDPLLWGVEEAKETVVAANGFSYDLTTRIDNDPSTSDVETEAELANSSLKEITISVSLNESSPGWKTAVPATVVLRRTRGN